MRRERPTLFKRRHFEAEVIVLCVRWYLRYTLKLSPTRRNHERAEPERRSCDDLAVGSAVCAGTEPPLPAGTTEYQSVVASRRDVLPGGREVDLFISGGGFHRRDHRLSPECEA